MRNWKFFLVVILFDYQKSLSRAYEELKPRSRPRNLRGNPCLSRAYEELKRVSSIWYFILSSLFIACLWGIETKLPSWVFNKTQPGLSRAYEELKPPNLTQPFPTLTCLSRAYEELKLYQKKLQFRKISSLSRAYEELKLSPLYCFFGSHFFVYRVPMRNWNWFFIFFFSFFAILFIACLWGIETNKLKGGPGYYMCLSRAYEELKQVNVFFYESFWICVYRVPMRNWNIIGDNISNAPAGMFIACLWGIETLWSQ